MSNSLASGFQLSSSFLSILAFDSCEYVQHLSMFEYIAITVTTENRLIEFVDHLHEHFLDPLVIKRGHYMPPAKAGYSIEMKKETLVDYEFLNGKIWKK